MNRTIRLGLTIFTLASMADSSRGQALMAVGLDEGGIAQVLTFESLNNTPRVFNAYQGFQGGVRVAVGDITGDGVMDVVTGAGPGGGPHIKVFDGNTQEMIRSFLAYAPAFTGGVFVGAADIDSDGRADIITGTDEGVTAHVKVFSGQTGAELRSFFPYGTAFLGGVRVAAGDVNNDGRADIITGAGAGAGPHVKVFDGRTSAEIRSFFAYDVSFTGGVYVAAGDVNGDGFADIVTGPGEGGTPVVRIFNGNTLELHRSFPVDVGQNLDGIRVGTHHGRNSDGDAIIAVLIGMLLDHSFPSVRLLHPETGQVLQSRFLGTPDYFQKHVFVAGSPPPRCAADFNNDGNRDPDDLADFITCFFLDVQFPRTCPRADFNEDSFRNPDDLADYITAFFLGCD
jgi:hypothetical protein